MLTLTCFVKCLHYVHKRIFAKWYNSMEYTYGRHKMKQFIEIGKIINTHGVKGAIKVEPWCDNPSVLAKMKRVYFAPKNKGDGYSLTNVLSGSVQKDKVLLSLEGISTVEAAILLKNTVIYANRDDIPIKEGSFLIADLIGLDVIDANSGRVYGKLTDVIQGGSGDIYDIKTSNGNALMPAVKEFVKEIRLDEGIFVTPIKGIFDED